MYVVGFCVLLTLGLAIISGHGQAAKEVSGKWYITTVDSKGKVGWYTSLALDKNENPWISYYDFSNGNLKCAQWTGKVWEIETVDKGESKRLGEKGYTGEYSSLAFDKNGTPWIYYYDQTYNTLKFAGRLKGEDSWTWGYVDIVGVEGNLGKGISFALDKDGNQKVSCYDETNSDLIYVKLVDGTWKTEIVDGKGDVGGSNSLALDKDGNPRISYFDQTNLELKYARWTGKTWKKEFVGNGDAPSLALDNNGDPRISFYAGRLNYAKWTGKAWKIETVDSKGNVGLYSSLVLDKNGDPRISYYDITNGDLKYAKWTGKTWKIETVDSKGDVGLHSSLVLDKNGNPRISYLDDTNGDLKYARGE